MCGGRVVLYHLQGVEVPVRVVVAADHHLLCDDGVQAHHGLLCNTCHSYNTFSSHSLAPATAPPPPSPGAAGKSPAGQSSGWTVFVNTRGQAEADRNHRERPEGQGEENQEISQTKTECSDDAGNE